MRRAGHSGSTKGNWGQSCTQQGTAWVMCLGMSSQCLLCARSLPGGGPQTLGVLTENSCGFISCERKLNRMCPGGEALPGSLGCNPEEMFPSQCMGIPHLFSVLHLLLKFCLFSVSSMNINWIVIWNATIRVFKSWLFCVESYYLWVYLKSTLI